jgi:hypothetical protein
MESEFSLPLGSQYFMSKNWLLLEVASAGYNQV